MLFVLWGGGQESDMLYEHDLLSSSSFTPLSSFDLSEEMSLTHPPSPPPSPFFSSQGGVGGSFKS